MNQNIAIKATVIVAVWMIAGSSMFNCSPPAAVGIGSGGSSGRGGQGGSISMEGGSNGHGGTNTVTFITIDLDAARAAIDPDASSGSDGPSSLTSEANCGMTSSETIRRPADVLLVLDRSLSMNYSIADICYCNTADMAGGGFGDLCSDKANCMNRWSAIKTAMKTTLADSKNVNWGLKFFSSPNSAECGVTNDPEVPIAADSASKIESQIENADQSLSTPTAAAILKATDYLKTVKDENSKIILLATDGEPNCGGKPASTFNDDVSGATNAVSAASAAGFPVYVIGIGPSVTNLSQLALAGGTDKDFFPANSADQLAEALSSISKLVGSCSFTAEEAPPDLNKVAVYVNKQQIPKDENDGWTFGATSQDIQLTGSYCQQIMDGIETKVQILFGCLEFPPILR